MSPVGEYSIAEGAMSAGTGRKGVGLNRGQQQMTLCWSVKGETERPFGFNIYVDREPHETLC